MDWSWLTDFLALLSQPLGLVIMSAVMGALGGLGVQWLFSWRGQRELRKAVIAGLHAEISRHVYRDHGTPTDPKLWVVAFSDPIFEAFRREIASLLPQPLARQVLQYYSYARVAVDEQERTENITLRAAAVAASQNPMSMVLGGDETLKGLGASIATGRLNVNMPVVLAISLRETILAELERRFPDGTRAENITIAEPYGEWVEKRLKNAAEQIDGSES